jgi:hypothetical protein
MKRLGAQRAKRRSPGGDRRSTCYQIRAGDRTRTGDVQLGKLAFYQLNYARDVKGKLASDRRRDNCRVSHPSPSLPQRPASTAWRRSARNPTYGTVIVKVRVAPEGSAAVTVDVAAAFPATSSANAIPLASLTTCASLSVPDVAVKVTGTNGTPLPN